MAASVDLSLQSATKWRTTPGPRLDDAPLDPEGAVRAGWHAAIHRLHWGSYVATRWRWNRGRSRDLVLSAAVLAFVGWNLRRAILPEYSPAPNEIPQSVRDRAALLFALCWWPMLRYLARRPDLRRPIPFLPLYGCLYSLYYALTPMHGLANYLAFFNRGSLFDPAVDYAEPVNLLLCAWILLLLGYHFAKPARADRESGLRARLRRLPVRSVVWSAASMLTVGLASEILERHGWWPEKLGGVSNLLLVAMEAALVVLVTLGARRRLPAWGLWTTLLGAGAALFLSLGGSATGSVLFILFALTMGIWLRDSSLPTSVLVAGVLALAGCAALRGVMVYWRLEVWTVRHGELSATERSTLMIDMLRQKIQRDGVAQAISDGWTLIGHRSANVDLLVDVIHRTPKEVPYWDGYTYRSLIGAFVPRVLWPDKPTKTLGQDFGHRYRYLNDRDLDTSLNLPVVVEFYINYGVTALLIGMFGFGMLLRATDELLNRPGQPLLVSAAAVPLLARFLVMECDLSLIFGGLPLQLTAFALIAVVILVASGKLVRSRQPRPPWYAAFGSRHAPVAGTAR